MGDLRQGEFLGQGGGRGRGGGDSGDHLAGDLLPFQDFQLLLNGAEQGGVAGMDPERPPAGPMRLNEAGDDLLQVQGRGVDQFGFGPGPAQHRRRHQGTGVEDDVGPGQGLLPFDRDQLRVSRPGPQKDDGMAFSHTWFLMFFYSLFPKGVRGIWSIFKSP